MSLDETAFIRYQNSRKGSISAPLIQSRAVESMYYCYHHLQKGEGSLNAAIEWTKRNLRCCGDTSIAQVEGSGSYPDITRTLKRWFEHHKDYGECPIQKGCVALPQLRKSVETSVGRNKKQKN